MPDRKGSARWEGGLKSGKGTISTETGVLQDTAYNFTSRFESGSETNPEELIGAAHAACYSMALSAALEGDGHDPEYVKTEDSVTITNQGEGFAITTIEIRTEASVPGMGADTFQEYAEGAKTNCPVSKALTGVEFVLHATLK